MRGTMTRRMLEDGWTSGPDAGSVVGVGADPRTRDRRRAVDVDLHVSRRIRQRRIMLGLTQQQLAELIGVTYQQAHKYETGINRISAGRLYQIARALGVGVDYFFEGLEHGEHRTAPSGELTPAQRLLLDLARHFTAIPSRRQQEAVCHLARMLASVGEEEPAPRRRRAR